MHPGGAKQTPMAKIRARHPEDILLNAVRRMLPRSALGRQMMTKLKVYAGDKHPHAAQKPAALSLARAESQPSSEAELSGEGHAQDHRCTH